MRDRRDLSDARGLAWQESDIIKGHEGQEGRERRKGYETVSNLMENKAL